MLLHPYKLLQVKVEDGMIYVSIKKHVSSSKFYRYNNHMFLFFFFKFYFKTFTCFPQSLNLTKRVKEMCSRIPDIKHTILLIGGGNKEVKYPWSDKCDHFLN